jgi:hypothetical protein
MLSNRVAFACASLLQPLYTRKQPPHDLDELERRGICSAKVRAILRELALAELQVCRTRQDSAVLELQRRILLGEMHKSLRG